MAVAKSASPMLLLALTMFVMTIFPLELGLISAQTKPLDGYDRV